MHVLQEPQTLVATGTVSLEAVAEQDKVSVADRIAQQDANLREWMATRIVRIFILANVVTLLVLGALVWLDQANLNAALIKPDERIVDHQVVKALLGATSVQIGTIAIIIARYLFPAGPADREQKRQGSTRRLSKA